MKKWLYFVGTFIILLDRVTKIIVMNLIELGESITVIPNYLYITYIKNDGAAWGMFSGNTIFLLFMTLITLIILLKVINEMDIKFINVLSYGLLIGGIIGNLIDRIIYGSVIDFIDTYIFTYDYPVFNVSDMAIVIGTSLLIIEILKGGGLKDEKVNSR
ncbi:MAG: signal peptidase II [Bacilli bacterium]|nr:signal peptidase II [Bacilli bacterium]